MAKYKISKLGMVNPALNRSQALVGPRTSAYFSDCQYQVPGYDSLRPELNKMAFSWKILQTPRRPLEAIDFVIYWVRLCLASAVKQIVPRQSRKPHTTHSLVPTI
ncbi:hypothetical protein J3459_016413 [Metarhizium acridum]|nr:hypothetical protein J3459_016413 [Metarhizium acridum]